MALFRKYGGIRLRLIGQKEWHSMTTSLDRFIDPVNYHPEAVINAARGNIADIDAGLLIIRLGVELYSGNRAGAQAAIKRLEADGRQGYELFQLMTAKLISALWTDDETVIKAALEAWLAARLLSPGNWFHEVLKAPELAPYCAQIEPAKLETPVLARYKVTKADRALVKNLDAARIQAVTENLEWLSEMGMTGSVKSIAKAYRIIHANQHLREVTLGCNNDDWPDLIVALDGDGAVLGSFIAH
jgi:hypothetical protein